MRLVKGILELNSNHRYNIQLISFTGRMKDGLQEFLNQKKDIMGIFIGTRSTDPYSGNLDF